MIPIIEQHHARFSAFEPTTLQHDESVSTNLPFISMRCLFCACTCLLRKETECSKGVREPHHRGQSLPFRAPDVTRLPSKGGGELAASRICQNPNCVYTITKPCQLSVMWVRAAFALPFRLFAPLRFFRFRRRTSWYVIGPCKPLDVTS